MTVPRKVKTAYYCSQCGAQHSKWQGQCRECGQWNCLIEERVPTSTTRGGATPMAVAQRLSEVTIDRQSGFVSGIVEFDRVLGGQLLAGMTVLLGGEPGIGKSTLVLQAAEAYSQQGLRVLYITGEESLPQIKRRADRLQVKGDNITVVNCSSLEQIIERVGTNEHQVVIIDSVQTVASEMFDSPPGTVAQVREAANKLIAMSKAGGWALFLVGHVTKEGMVAGPKVLEHMVDTVVYFEGDSSHLYRMLRATKNRFGSIAEIGLFEMAERGLIEVANPSSLFLTGHSDEPRSGSVVAGIVEGNRPILVELQALVTAAGYSNPQRVAGGIDNKRLSLLLAILEKRCDYPMATNDVFVSVAGGLKLSEPGIDLPLLVAIVSSLLNRNVDSKTICVGEVGLSGEVRPVTMVDRRINEAARMGFTRMILPQANLEKSADKPIEMVGVTNLQAALEVVG